MTLEEQLDDLEPLVRWVSRQWFVPGHDVEDLEQECRFILVRELHHFDPDRGRNLRSFAKLLLERWLITLLKTEQREKRGGGLGTVSLDAPALSIPSENDAEPLGEILDVGAPSVHRQVVAIEQLRALVRGDGLSGLEHRSLVGVCLNVRYDRLGDPKQVDNAVQRGRRKVAA